MAFGRVLTDSFHLGGNTAPLKSHVLRFSRCIFFEIMFYFIVQSVSLVFDILRIGKDTV